MVSCNFNGDLTMVGTDDGEIFFTLHGKLFDNGEFTVDMSMRGGPDDCRG